MDNLLFSKLILSTKRYGEKKFEKEDSEENEGEQEEISSFDFTAQRKSCERNVSFFDKHVILLNESKRTVKRRTSATAILKDLDVLEFDASEVDINEYVSEDESESMDFEIPPEVTPAEKKKVTARLKEIKWSPTPDPRYSKLPYPEADYVLDRKYLRSNHKTSSKKY